MKLNLIERLITNSPLRAFGQRNIQGPLLRRLAGKERYPLCLEIGCGRGVGATVILRRFGAERVISTDADPEQVERAKRGLSPEFRERVEFKVQDAMALAEPDGAFDAVFSFGVIHHTEDWRRAVREVSRVLKPGGEFFFEELLKPFLRTFPVGRLTAHPEGGMFTLEEFKAGLTEAGLELTGLRRFGDILVFGAAGKPPL